MKHEELSYHVKYYGIKLGVSLALALFIFLFREPLIEHIKYFIGGLMIIYGLEEVVHAIYFHGKEFWKQERVFLGYLEILLGGVLLFSPLTIETVCIIWASWSILKHSFEIRELVVEIKSWTLTIISGIESIAIIVFSIMLILEPGEHHAMMHLYLLLVELFLTPFVPMMDALFENFHQTKQE